MASGHIFLGRIKVVKVIQLFKIILLFVCFSTFPALGQADGSEAAFHSAAAAYSQGQFSEAEKGFLEFLKTNPDDAGAHLNLASIYARQAKWGPSWAYFRKARSLNPSLSGLADLQVKLSEHPPSPLTLSGLFHKRIRPLLAEVNPFFMTSVLLILLTAYGHFLVRYLKKRKWAMEAKEPLPQMPFFLWAIFSFSILALTVVLLQSYLRTQTYASVVAHQGVALKSLPAEDGLEVGNLPAGVELKVLRNQGEWIQVTNENGNSGWLHQEALLVYTGSL